MVMEKVEEKEKETKKTKSDLNFQREILGEFP